MFDNIGGKIKTFAETVAYIGFFAFIIIGLIIMILGIANETFSLVIVGILVALIGFLYCWVSVFLLYGFGQLVENSDIIARTLSPNYKEDLNDNKKIEEISNVELEKISNEYSNSNWQNSIKDLSNEELQERVDSEDWQFEYRALCKKELENRKKAFKL